MPDLTTPPRCRRCGQPVVYCARSNGVVVTYNARADELVNLNTVRGYRRTKHECGK